MSAELKEEVVRMKQQLAQLEKALTSLRVHGHELKCQATAMHVNITRITNEVCGVSSSMGFSLQLVSKFHALGLKLRPKPERGCS